MRCNGNACDKIKDYVDAVCGQVRWKAARREIEAELTAHICDQRDAYISSGESEEKAVSLAVEEMGDPVITGCQLDAVHRPKPQWGMLLIASLLIAVGMIARTLIFGSEFSGALFLPLVLAVMLGAYFLDFSVLGRYAVLIAAVTAVGAAMCILISPSHTSLVKLSSMPYVFSFVYALLLYGMREKGLKGELICTAAFVLFLTMSLYIPSVCGAFIFLTTALVLSIASYKKRFFVKNRGELNPSLLHLMGFNEVELKDDEKSSDKAFPLLPLCVAFAYLVPIYSFFKFDYMREKLKLAIDPYLDPNGRGYIALNIRKMIENSQLLGEGSAFYNSEKFLEMPLLSSDYILTSVAYRFGIIAAAALVIAFAVLVVLGFYKTSKVRNTLGFMVSLSVMVIFLLQIVMYIISNLGVNLMLAHSLPFISFGNTATLINAALFGFMLSVFRRGEFA